jgi:hypothetical protein
MADWQLTIRNQWAIRNQEFGNAGITMTPAELRPEHFAAYPPLGRQIAVRNLDVLRRLPLAFVPLLLREVIAYDWKFPAERQEVDAQFAYMSALPQAQLTRAMAAFDQLTLSPALTEVGWVRSPAEFSEQLSAHLWSTGQVASFRLAAIEFLNAVRAAIPPPMPATPRLGIVVVGQGVAANRYQLFRKLRRHGTYFTQVDAQGGLELLIRRLGDRAKSHPGPFAHWYIDGGAPTSSAPAGVELVAYRQLDSVRDAVVAKMRGMTRAGVGSEAQRSGLMQLRPADVGLDADGPVGILNHFKVSVLAEGSGVQFFSTTFVQWAAREVWRRAQPLTLLARFTPRMTEHSMNEALLGTSKPSVLDAEGALVDGDIGAYYTWLNQMRLTGADQSAFVAWFENHTEAIAVSPSTPRGVESHDPIDFSELLENIAPTH